MQRNRDEEGMREPAGPGGLGWVPRDPGLSHRGWGAHSPPPPPTAFPHLPLPVLKRLLSGIHLL